MMRAAANALITAVVACTALTARSAGFGQLSDQKELRIRRVLPARPNRVFHLWTDTDLIKRWFIYHADVHWSTDPGADLKLGGHFRWRVAGNEDENEVFEFHGEYRDIRPPKKLAFTWEWESLPIPGVEGPGKTLVTVEFATSGDETAVVLAQTGFDSDAARSAHEKGWNRCFDGMEDLLRTQR